MALLPQEVNLTPFSVYRLTQADRRMWVRLKERLSHYSGEVAEVLLDYLGNCGIAIRPYQSDYKFR